MYDVKSIVSLLTVTAAGTDITTCFQICFCCSTITIKIFQKLKATANVCVRSCATSLSRVVTEFCLTGRSMGFQYTIDCASSPDLPPPFHFPESSPQYCLGHHNECVYITQIDSHSQCNNLQKQF